MRKLFVGLVLVFCLAVVGCARYFDEPFEAADLTYVPDYLDVYDGEDGLDDYEESGARVLFEVPVFGSEYYYDEYYNEEIYEYEEYAEPVAVVDVVPTSLPDVVVATPYVPVATVYVPEVTEPAAQYNFIGNVNSLIFHLMTCDTLPIYRNRVYFVEREDAIYAGHRACLRCQP